MARRPLRSKLRDCCDFSLASPSSGLGKWSLRFKAASTELGFVEQWAESLTKQVFKLSTAIGFIISVFLANQLFTTPDLEKNDNYHGGWVFVRVMDFLALFTSIVMAALMKAQQKRQLFSAHGMEKLVLCWLFIMALYIPFSEQYLVGIVFFGQPYPRSRVDIAWMPMATLMLAEVANSVLSIRWCVVWPMTLMTLLPYPVVWYIVQPSAGKLPSTVMISLLGIFCTVLSKISNETQQRAWYMTLIKERTSRARSEFELSRTKADLGNPRRTTGANTDGFSQLSAHTAGSRQSSDSGLLFEGETELANNLVKRLERLVVVGRREHWLLNPDRLHLHLQEPLGFGNHSAAFEGLLHGASVVVKFPIRRFGADAIQRASDISECLRTMRQVRHPCLVALYGAAIEPAHCGIALVVERVQGLPLNEFMCTRSKKRLVDGDIFQILNSIASALACLHTNFPTILHGSLKPSGVIVQPDAGGSPTTSARTSVGRVLLSDWGLARIVARHGPTIPSPSEFWSAPELISISDRGGVEVGLGLSASADSFSFGRIAHFTLSGGVRAFQGKNRHEMRDALKNGDLGIPIRPKHLTAFMGACWEIAGACALLSIDARLDMDKVSQRLFVAFGGAGQAKSFSSDGAWDNIRKVVDEFFSKQRASRRSRRKEKAKGPRTRGGSSDSESDDSSHGPLDLVDEDRMVSWWRPTSAGGSIASRSNDEEQEAKDSKTAWHRAGNAGEAQPRDGGPLTNTCESGHPSAFGTTVAPASSSSTQSCEAEARSDSRGGIGEHLDRQIVFL